MAIALLVNPNRSIGTPKYWAFDRATLSLYYAQVSNAMSIAPKGVIVNLGKAVRTMDTKRKNGYIYLADVANSRDLRDSVAAIAGEAPQSAVAHNILKGYLHESGDSRAANGMVFTGAMRPVTVLPAFDLPSFVPGSVVW
jgi:hypothetical protein